MFFIHAGPDFFTPDRVLWPHPIRQDLHFHPSKAGESFEICWRNELHEAPTQKVLYQEVLMGQKSCQLRAVKEGILPPMALHQKRPATLWPTGKPHPFFLPFPTKISELFRRCPVVKNIQLTWLAGCDGKNSSPRILETPARSFLLARENGWKWRHLLQV